MCIGGLAPAYLSLNSCAQEIRAGLLAVLPLPNNPLNRRWFVVHTQSKVLSRVSSVFMAHPITRIGFVLGYCLRVMGYGRRL